MIRAGNSGHRPDLPALRRHKILLAVRRDGWLHVNDLASHLGVSPGTVRRDLRALANQGLLPQLRDSLVDYGGSPIGADRSRLAPATARITAAHASIVGFAADLVQPETTIAVTADPIAEPLARCLLGVRRLTIVTNSLPVGALMSRHQPLDHVLVMTGGVPSGSGGLAGPAAEAALHSLNIDQLFYAPYGVSARSGYTASDMADVGVVRAFIAASRTKIILADHGRWNTVGIASVAPLNAATQVVSDGALPPAAQRAISRAVRDVSILPLS